MNDSKLWEFQHRVLNLSPDFNPSYRVSIPFEAFTFPGGEQHIKIAPLGHLDDVLITCRLNSSNDLILLCLAVDALRRMGVNKISAFIPYFPYARQDRVNVVGEPLSVKVVADIINGLRLQSVIIFDPHSDVCSALLDNVQAIDNTEFVRHIFTGLNSGYALVAPDAGAIKKIHKVAEKIGYQGEILVGSKTRCTKTGEITGTDISAQTLDPELIYFIVDDICDGGRTFTELAKVMRERGAKRIILVVSHGIFSKGFQPFDGLIDEVYATDSFPPQYKYSTHLTQRIIKFTDFLSL